MTDALARSAPSRVSPWGGLFLLMFPIVVLALDLSVLFLATPVITRSLGASPAEVLWITDVYGFFIAGFLILMGTLGDRVGRRRLLVWGSVGFAAASACAAFAQSPVALIVARAAMGLAGATLMPSSLSLIRVLFPAEQQRQKAIAVWMTAFSGSMALGPVLGGWVVDSLWWGAIFLIPVPLLLVFAVLGSRMLPEYKVAESPPLDAASSVMVLVSMLGMAYVVKALAGGVLDALTVGLAVVTAAVSIATGRRQFVVPHPLIDPALLRDRRLLIALFVLSAGIMSMNGMYFLLPQYLQHIVGHSALHTGLLLLPVALVSILASVSTPMLAGRMRPSFDVALGAAVAAVGFTGWVVWAGHVGTAVLITLACIVAVGISIMGVIMTDLVVGVAPSEQAGAAAGMSETANQMGVALGVTLFGSVHLFFYRSAVMSDPAPLDGRLREAAASSVADVASLASQGGGQALKDAAEKAFVGGMSAAGAIGLIAMLASLTVALTVLRNATTDELDADKGGVTG